MNDNIFANEATDKELIQKIQTAHATQYHTHTQKQTIQPKNK